MLSTCGWIGLNVWVSLGGTADAAALRIDLKAHLEKEFAANQKTRQAELEQLQQLLEQAREWLNKRESNRSKIVKQCLQELLERR